MRNETVYKLITQGHQRREDSMRNNKDRGEQLTPTHSKWLFVSLTIAALSTGIAIGSETANADTDPATSQISDESAQNDVDSAVKIPKVEAEDTVKDDSSDDGSDNQLDVEKDDNSNQLDNEEDNGEDTIDEDEEKSEDETEEPVSPADTPDETVTPAPTNEQTPKSDFTFHQTSENTVEVTGYTGAAQQQADGSAPVSGYSTEITIPDMYEGKYVSGIADNAFNNDGSANDHLTIVSALTKVILGKNLNYIGQNAFANNALTSLTLQGATWINIKAGAFKNNELTNVELNGAVQIEQDAFKGNQLTTLVLPDTVNAIGASAFENNQLTDLTLSAALESIGTSAFANNQIGGTLILPAKLTTLGEYAFADNRLTSVTLNQVLTDLNTGTFANNQLTGLLTIPDNIVRIGDSAFSNDKKQGAGLTALHLGTGVQYIGNQAFTDNALTNLEIPDTTDKVSVGDEAFSGNQLRTLKLGKNVSAIGNSAFADNQLTETLSVPDAVEKIGNRAFIGNQLTGLNLGSQITAIGDFAFANNQLGGTLILPEKVSLVGESAFENNLLTGLQLVNKEASLGANAFAQNALEKINSADMTWTNGGNAFSNQKALTLANVPMSTTSAHNIKALLVEQLNMKPSDIGELTFTLSDGTSLNYDKTTDSLLLPQGFDTSHDGNLTVTLTTNAAFTGQLGFQALTLDLRVWTFSGQVDIPVAIKNINSKYIFKSIWSAVISGQVGSTQLVDAPVMAGYRILNPDTQQDITTFTAIFGPEKVTTRDTIEYLQVEPDDNDSGETTPTKETEPVDPETGETVTPYAGGEAETTTTSNTTGNTPDKLSDKTVTDGTTNTLGESANYQINQEQKKQVQAQKAWAQVQYRLANAPVGQPDKRTHATYISVQPKMQHPDWTSRQAGVPADTVDGNGAMTEPASIQRMGQAKMVMTATSLPQTNEQTSQWHWLEAIGLLAASWLGFTKKKQDD